MNKIINVFKVIDILLNLILEQSSTKICRDYNELEKIVLEKLKKAVK